MTQPNARFANDEENKELARLVDLIVVDLRKHDDGTSVTLAKIHEALLTISVSAFAIHYQEKAPQIFADWATHALLQLKAEFSAKDK